MDRSTLNKATSADDTPTPGYLYTEIAQATFSAPDAPQQLADYLLKKLERDNPHVKLKCLRVIKHVCEQGKPDFRRAVQKKAEIVKACLQYRGAPDPLKGDAPNRAVREEADAAVKAVFSSDSSTNAYGLSVDGGKKMQGFGSETATDLSSRIGGFSGQFSGPPPPGGSSFGSHNMGGMGGAGGPKSFGGGGMVGFGNPNFDNSPKEPVDSVLKQAMSSTLSAVTKMASKVPGISAAVPAPAPEPQMNMYRAPPVGGGYGGQSNPGFGSGAQGRWGADSGGGPPRPPTSHKDPGEYEARVVNELCALGGPRVAPTQQALEDFCKKCESLDASCVGDLLRQKLGASGDQAWQIRLKALHAVEALSNHGLDGIVGHLTQYSSELLFECQDMPQCRQKASKVLHMLGLIDQPEDRPTGRRQGDAGPSAAASAAAAAAPAVDLLDMDDDLPGASSEAYQPPAAGGIDLFETGPAPTTNGAGSFPTGGGAPSGLLDLGEESAPAPAAGGGGSLFGSLSVHGGGGASSAVPSPATGPSLLSGLELQAGGGGGSLFSNMQLGGTAGAGVPAGTAGPQVPPSGPPGPFAGGGGLPGQLGGGTGALGGPGALGAAGAGGPHPGGAQAGANRTAHLSILSGGGSGAMPMQGMGGMMGGGPAMMGGMHGGMGASGMMGMGGALPNHQPLAHGFPGQGGYGGAPLGGHFGMQGAVGGSFGPAYGIPQPQAPYPGLASTGPAFGPAAGGGGGAAGGGGPSAFGFIGGAAGASGGMHAGLGLSAGLGEGGFGAPSSLGGSGGFAVAGAANHHHDPPGGSGVDSAFSFVADQMKTATR